MYAFMQAMGLVNDHIDGCDLRKAVEQARAEFVRP
jgi:DNA-3-methyladenine glycosylase I